jgi:hypothetical protein
MAVQERSRRFDAPSKTTRIETTAHVEEEKNTKQINSPTKYHKFVVLVRLENEVWLVKLTVRESEQKKRFYDHATVQKIKNSAWDDTGKDIQSLPPASGISTANVRKLYEEYNQKLASSNGLGRVETQSTAIRQKQRMQSRLQRAIERDSSPEMQEKVRRAAVLMRLPVPVPQKPVAVQRFDAPSMTTRIETRGYCASSSLSSSAAVSCVRVAACF